MFVLSENIYIYYLIIFYIHRAILTQTNEKKSLIEKKKPYQLCFDLCFFYLFKNKTIEDESESESFKLFFINNQLFEFNRFNNFKNNILR